MDDRTTGRRVNRAELNVVIRFTADAVEQVQADIVDALTEAVATAEDLDELTVRVERLRDTTGIGVPPAATGDDTARAVPAARTPTWAELAEKADAHLREGGIDPAEVSLDGLLPTGILDRVVGVDGDVDLRARLDPYDVAAAVAAAAVGTFLDFVVVKIPTGVRWRGRWQRGSLLTFLLRRQAVHSDNWLASLAPVPFDQVGVPLSGLGPRSHRVQTFGHDPLLGLVYGTMDILRGTLTGTDAAGSIAVLDAGPPTPGVVTALGREVLHLVSDVGTRMGLPLPGWTALTAIPWGEIGTDGRTVAGLARWMYLRGYGSWHFLTMATVPAAIETALRAYVAMRRLTDDVYARRWQAEGAAAGDVTDHPRYRILSLVAHGITAAGNAGRVALSGFNPLAVNYTEWLVFIKKLVTAVETRPRSERLLARVRSSRLILDTGWARLGIDGDRL